MQTAAASTKCLQKNLLYKYLSGPLQSFSSWIWNISISIPSFKKGIAQYMVTSIHNFSILSSCIYFIFMEEILQV